MDSDWAQLATCEHGPEAGVGRRHPEPALLHQRGGAHEWRRSERAEKSAPRAAEVYRLVALRNLRRTNVYSARTAATRSAIIPSVGSEERRLLLDSQALDRCHGKTAARELRFHNV